MVAFGVIFELLGKLAGVVVAKALTLGFSGGTFDDLERVVASGNDGEAERLNRLVDAGHLPEFGGGQLRSEAQPMEDGEPLFDRWVHGDFLHGLSQPGARQRWLGHGECTSMEGEILSQGNRLRPGARPHSVWVEFVP